MSEVRVFRADEMPPGTVQASVAIVGAGACGLTAALMLRDAGIDCVLLERDERAQGSTALSSGFVPAAGTAVQRAAGIVDSPAQFASDIQAKAHGTAAPHLVRAYTETIAPALDALQQRHGLEFELLEGFLYPGHSAYRMHTLPQRTGAALMAALEAAAVRADATLLTESLVRELWCTSAGRVLGVGFERPDGRMEHLACDWLLLACNGFGGNADMVQALLPQMRDATFAGHVGNDGSAIAWGRQLGAGLADLGGYQGHGSWAVPQGTLISWAVMMDGGIQVNRLGHRFHDESQGYSEAAVQVLAQPDSIAWNVFDETVLQLALRFPDFCAAKDAGAVRRCDSIAALAQMVGCEEAALQETLSTIRTGTTDAFSRTFSRRLEAPYFAVKVTGALFHTQGGLSIDAQCQVLLEDGTALPNLLAAGGAARGVSGNAVWGYLSGNGLLSALAGGFIAARTIADGVAGRR